MEKLIEQLQQGTFYYSKFGLNIKAKIINVVEMDDNTFYVSFEGGSCSLYTDKLKNVYAPSNIVRGVYKWCYELNNHQGELIGFIALKENTEVPMENKRVMRLNQVNDLEEFKVYILNLKNKRKVENKDHDSITMVHIAISLGGKLVRSGIISNKELNNITYENVSWLC